MDNTIFGGMRVFNLNQYVIETANKSLKCNLIDICNEVTLNKRFKLFRMTYIFIPYVTIIKFANKIYLTS